MTPLKPSRATLACVFVLASLTACESGKTGEQAAQSEQPPAHTATTPGSPALPVTPPPAPSDSSDQEATTHPNKATEPAPDVAPIKPSPVPEPRVLANEAPTADGGGASAEATVAKVPDTTKDDDDFETRSAEGGTLTGKVTFKGVPPAPKTFAFNKFPNPGFCSKIDSDGNGNRVVQDVKVGKDNALKDVVVYVEGVQGGKPFNFEGTKLTADGCRFLVQGGPSTFAGVVVKKKEIQIENMDAVENPYYAIVGDDGTFTISDIPPGTYEVYAWHPTLGKQEANVTIRAKGHATADFSFAAK